MLREERRRREEWKRITVQSLDRSKDELHFNDNRDVRNAEREREEYVEGDWKERIEDGEEEKGARNEERIDREFNLISFSKRNEASRRGEKKKTG